MSEDTIAKTLSSDDVSRQIVFACKEGAEASALISFMIQYYRRKGFTAELEQLQGYIVGRIIALESIKAIVFKEGKWFATDSAKAVSSKYFGF